MMNVINIKKGSYEPNMFPMSEMKHGDICYCPEIDSFVLAVGYYGQPLVFMVIDGDEFTEQAKTYGSKCRLLVRPIYDGESITVEFS